MSIRGGGPACLGTARHQGGNGGSGLEEPLRIHGIPVDAGFIMEMGTGGAPRRADAAEDGAGLDLLTHDDRNAGQMGVAAGHALRMLDLDHVAIGTRMFGGYHPTRPAARTGAPNSARKSRPVCMAGPRVKGSVRMPKPLERSISPSIGSPKGSFEMERRRW